MGGKIACSMPGCRADVAGEDQRMSEETRKSLIAKFSPRADTRQGQENSVIQRTTEHVETNHGEERKEGEEEASVNQIETSQTKEENSLPNTYPQGEENYHISDLEPDKEPDNCDVESEDFWDECYALISEKKDDANEILSENQVEETLPEGSASSFEEDVVELNERYALIAEKKDDTDEIQSENLVEETLPEGPAKSVEADVVELNEGLTSGKKDDPDEILSENLVEETIPEDSAKGSEEDFVELNEVPDEFIGAWALTVKEPHTDNFDGYLIASKVPWLMRKAVIAMIGNVADQTFIKQEGGMDWLITSPKTPVKPMRFGKEVEVAQGGVFPNVVKYTIRAIRENGKHKLLTTESTSNGTLTRRENYIREDGIMVQRMECNGAVMVRRYDRVDQNPI